jgi:hypothetical protein
MGGAAPEVDGNGDIWLGVGNGSVTSPSGPYDDSDSVVELSAQLGLLQFFAPSNWYAQNAIDEDLGSTAPALLSNGTVLEVGKSQTAYLLSQSTLGGIGGQLTSASTCSGHDADGGTAANGTIAYVPCQGGVEAIATSSSPPWVTVNWQTATGAGGPPIVAGGYVWSIGGATLYALDPSTGALAHAYSLGSEANHFPTPSVGAGLLLAPESDRVLALSGSSGIPTAPTTTTITSVATPYSASSQDVTLSATVTSPGATVNGGTVSFSVLAGATLIGSITTSPAVSAGAASVSYAIPAGTPAGIYTIDAVYNPGAGFSLSADDTHTLAITNPTLPVGSALFTGAPLVSQNGAYQLIVQSDGNVVVYGPPGAMWSTGTYGTGGDELALQSDGNLVLYGPQGAIWSSVTYGGGATELAMQNDGNLVLYGPQGAVWSTMGGFNNVMTTGRSLGPSGYLPSPDDAYRLVMQGDGNVVVWHGGMPVWSTGTSGRGGNELVLQSDGNLVLYGSHGAVWSSGTYGTGAGELAMQSDGNLVLYGPRGAVWSSFYG